MVKFVCEGPVIGLDATKAYTLWIFLDHVSRYSPIRSQNLGSVQFLLPKR